MNAFQELQAWYVVQCDGEWEHQQGITIESLDNPGWRLFVDLEGTALENAPFAHIQQNMDSVTDWLECRVVDNQFQGGCGSLLLESLIQVFIDWTKSQPD